MRLSCGIAGVWWLCFTLITWKRLPSRPGPPLPLGENYLWYSWKQTISTISSLKELSQILRFLLAWFFLSDGLTTLVTLSVMYGKAELNMPEAEIALAALVTPFAAFAGTHIWLKLQREFKLTTRDTVLLLSSLYCLIPAYALMGFVAPIGLNQTWEVWVVSVYNGFLLGAIQSYARVMFAELLPPGKEAQFFGLYSLTGRGSAWIGPLVTATLADWTHELRWGYGYILIELALTVWLISGVSTHVGRREVRNWQSRDHQLLVSLENL